MHSPSQYLEITSVLMSSRGINKIAWKGHELPLDTALDADGLSPLLVLDIASLTNASGMFNGSSFPFGIEDDPSQSSLLQHRVVSQPSPIPLSIALMFTDYKIEQLCSLTLDMGLSTSSLSFDPLTESLSNDIGKSITQSPSLSMF